MKISYTDFNCWLDSLKECHFQDTKKKIIAKYQNLIIGEFNKITLDGWSSQ